MKGLSSKKKEEYHRSHPHIAAGGVHFCPERELFYFTVLRNQDRELCPGCKEQVKYERPG